MAVSATYSAAASLVLHGSIFDHVSGVDLAATGTISVGTDAGGDFIQSAGSGNHLLASRLNRIDTALGGTWVCKFSTTQTGVATLTGTLDTGAAYFETVLLNSGDTGGAVSNGHIGLYIRGSNGAIRYARTTNNPNINDGNVHTVVIEWARNSQERTIYVDGVSVGVTYYDDAGGNPSANAGLCDFAHAVFARNLRGTFDQNCAAKIYTLGRLRSDGFDLAALSANPGAMVASGDGTAPTLIGSVTFSSITQTSYTAQWPAGSDNVAVAGYEYQIGSTAGAWTNAGNSLSAAITGRTAGTTETVYVRAYDAAGNRSTPAISGSVTLASPAAAGINVTEPLKNNTGTVLASQSGVRVAVLKAADLVSVYETTGMTTNASGILATISDAAIITGQQYHVAIKLADGGVGITGPITAS